MNRKKILVVEDNPDHANLITEIMLERDSGEYEKEIILMKDGQEAMDFLKKDIDGYNGVKSQIDLVLLDIDLPKVNGLEILKFIRKSPKYNSVPVIILSTNYDRNIIAEAYDNGADSYIVKPISYEVFAGNIMDMEDRWLIKGFSNPKYVGCSDFLEYQK